MSNIKIGDKVIMNDCYYVSNQICKQSKQRKGLDSMF